MIVATGGEFLDAAWRGEALVACDPDGQERVRITWTGWPHATRTQRLHIAWHVCALALFPNVRRVAGARQFTDPVPLAEPPP